MIIEDFSKASFAPYIHYYIFFFFSILKVCRFCSHTRIDRTLVDFFCVYFLFFKFVIQRKEATCVLFIYFFFCQQRGYFLVYDPVGPFPIHSGHAPPDDLPFAYSRLIFFSFISSFFLFFSPIFNRYTDRRFPLTLSPTINKYRFPFSLYHFGTILAPLLYLFLTRIEFRMEDL